VKLRIRLDNFKGVFAHVWFNIAMTSDRLSFASVEIDKNYLLTLPPWKSHVTTQNLGGKKSLLGGRGGRVF